MTRIKLLTIAVVGLLLINIGTLSFIVVVMRPAAGQDKHQQRGEGPKHFITERLGFDATQQHEYELIIHEHRSGADALNRESRDLHNELYLLLKEEPVNKTKADSIIERIAMNQKATDELNFGHFQKIKAICRNEQVEKFNALAAELAGLFGGPPH